MNTKPRLHFAAALFGAATLAVSAMTTLLPGTARAQTAVTDPVGYLSVALPANSDTFVSIPFTRPAEFTGAVASVATTGTAPNTVGTITLAGTPGFTANAYTPLATVAPNDGHKTYYVIIGPKSVALTPTVGVTNGSAALTASAALPSDFAVGDTVTVAGTASGTATAASYTFTVAAFSGTGVTLDRAYPGNTATGLTATYNHSPSEGRFYTVTANDAGSLTVNLSGDSLSNVTVGTQVSVIPYWTFGTSFPASDAGKSFAASTGTSVRTRASQIFIPDLSGVGINRGPTFVYYFYSGAWRQANDTNTANSHDDDLLIPDAYFIVRNVNTPTTFTPNGSVAVNRVTTPLATLSSTAVDVPVALVRPTSVSLVDLGLVVKNSVDPSKNAFTASNGTSVRNRADQLFVYDNVTAQINKSPVDVYYYYNNAWRSVNDTTNGDIGATTFISPGAGLTIRKAATQSTVPVFWQNARNFLN